MSLLIKAAQLAEYVHRDQKRKLTGHPYVEHCGRVAARIMRHDKATEHMVIAAFLHDSLEDTDIDLWTLTRQFPGIAVDYIKALTNPSKQYPSLSRAERKLMDRDHLKKCSPEVRIIKMADRADNMRDICHPSADRAWAQTYIIESYRLAYDIMIPVEPLFDELRAAIVQASIYHGMTQEQVTGG